MLTLNPGSSCDVCAEEYGPHCLPHSIPCGHVLCSSCCSTIAEKTTSRLSPACPFCRENFTSDSVRLIRMDFNTSGWSTPRRLPNIEANVPDFTSDAWSRRLALADGCSRSRQDARRLEAKVAKVAAKKCSVEEVTTLHKELQEWLTSDTKSDDDTSSLTLSAALLRAILMNHLAHSEASRLAKNVESTLKTKLDDLENAYTKLNAELRQYAAFLFSLTLSLTRLLSFSFRQRHAYAQKAQECQSLRQELNRLKVVSTTLVAPPPPPPSESRHESRHRSPSPPPVPPMPSGFNAPSSMSRFGTTHMRSASMFASSPGIARSQTPGPMSSTRSQTPAPARSQTPGPTRSNSISHSSRMELSPTRAQTPAPPSRASTMTPTPTRQIAMSAASAPLRSRTPAPPTAAPRARTLSHPSPPKLAHRTLSEEKYDAQAQHQRWLPHAYGGSDEREKAGKFTARSPSRMSQNYGGYRHRVYEEED
ncbi:RING-type domain-containing protein [Mycena venus]|uniref:RING-type domain-containing protein n=1 Tax=Mycena venus TaxID=2733690 RepID=A0A8H7DDP5_9AGAR|nr:RING-type domain-containing protein [Mycena venus]